MGYGVGEGGFGGTIGGGTGPGVPGGGTGQGISFNAEGLPFGQAATLADFFGRGSTMGQALTSGYGSQAIMGLMGTLVPGAGLIGSLALANANPPLGGVTPTPGLPGDYNTTTQGTNPANRAQTLLNAFGSGQISLDQLVSGMGGNFDWATQQQQPTVPQATTATPDINSLLAQLTADYGLTGEENQDINDIYESELAALSDRFGIEMEYLGGKQMADLVSRGMWGTSTGEQSVARTQQQFSDILLGEQSKLQYARDLAKTDLESAKKEIAESKYQLLTGMTQSQLENALNASMAYQNYYLTQGASKANESLTNSLIEQAKGKAAYQQRSSLWSGLSNLGMGLLSSGISSLF